MNKKIIYGLLSFLFLLGVSCKEDSNEIVETAPYDHESQIPIDEAKLYTYFEQHYMKETVDDMTGDFKFEILAVENEELPEGEILLSEDPKLDSIVGIKANSTVADYKMYYYITAEGADTSGFGSPSPIDSVYVKYTGMLLDGTVFDSKIDYPIWLQLSRTVQGWSRSLPKFKRGTFDTASDKDHIFDEQGKGFLFFPSGLGYLNFSQANVPPNAPLVFEIELDDVHLIDTDLDAVPTKYEMTIDAAGGYTFYDTDGDGFDDYSDVDDDNDQKLTKDEVAAEYPTFDARGNIEFEYDTTGMKIVSKGTTDGVPNYKLKDKK
tara:strand:+ start:11180 stop:12142 length:963 start_codon:yes stop_codon:yes gene_type:complete